MLRNLENILEIDDADFSCQLKPKGLMTRTTLHS